jgi:hypothetical protein
MSIHYFLFSSEQKIVQIMEYEVSSRNLNNRIKKYTNLDRKIRILKAIY